MSPRRARAVAGRVGDDPATALREHLVDTAERLLAERPMPAITTRDIARGAGVSEGVLYNYFHDKNDLLVTALVRHFNRMVGRYDASLPAAGTGTVEGNLLAFARAVLDLNADALPTATVLLAEPGLLHRFMQEIHHPPGPQIFWQRIHDYLAEEHRLGRIGEVDAEAVATVLIGSAAVLVLSSHVRGRSRADITAALPGIVRTLIDGLDIVDGG